MEEIPADASERAQTQIRLASRASTMHSMPACRRSRESPVPPRRPAERGPPEGTSSVDSYSAVLNTLPKFHLTGDERGTSGGSSRAARPIRAKPVATSGNFRIRSISWTVFDGSHPVSWRAHGCRTTCRTSRIRITDYGNGARRHDGISFALPARSASSLPSFMKDERQGAGKSACVLRRAGRRHGPPLLRNGVSSICVTGAGLHDKCRAAVAR